MMERRDLETLQLFVAGGCTTNTLSIGNPHLLVRHTRIAARICRPHGPDHYLHIAGKPVFDSVGNEFNLYLATAIWWAVFYSPGDIVYSIVTSEV